MAQQGVPRDGQFTTHPHEPVLIACDESGSEGERLTGATHDIFAHASVKIGIAEAEDIVTEIRYRAPSQAPEYKSSQLLLPRNYPTLRWLLREDGPLKNRAHVHLTEKSYFVVGKVIDLLIEELAYEAGIDLYAGGRARDMAITLYQEGRRAFGDQRWEDFLEAFNSLMRVKDRRQAKVSVDEFFSVVDTLRLQSKRRRVENIMSILWEARPQAQWFQDRLVDDPSSVPALDPLFAALPLAAEYWGQRRFPVSIVHDEQAALTDKRVDQLRQSFSSPHPSLRPYVPRIELRDVQQVDSRKDARVQVADLLAGASRVVASDELNGRGDPALCALIRPYVDSHSLWGDSRSWAKLSPDA